MVGFGLSVCKPFESVIRELISKWGFMEICREGRSLTEFVAYCDQWSALL